MCTIVGVTKLCCFVRYEAIKTHNIHVSTTETYLTTIHGNSWDCPVLSSLSQLLPDTLPDLISDTRSALLRDSLWWEAGKEDGSNNDQAEHCHIIPVIWYPHNLLSSTLYVAALLKRFCAKLLGDCKEFDPEIYSCTTSRY